jgi:hypothetical protein
MGKYFDYSQQIKKEIEGRVDLTQKLREHFSGKTPLEYIGGGSSNDIYSLGRLESGIYVALRESKVVKEVGLVEEFLQVYEGYCQYAEQLSSTMNIGKVVSFCVGASIGRDGRAGILLEDFSEGKKKTLLEQNDGLSSVCFETGETFLTDLDVDEISPKGIKFFAPEHRINII